MPELVELLLDAGLSTQQQRAVYDAAVDSMIEGAAPDRESLLRLIEFAAGRISFDEYKRRAIARAPGDGNTTSLICRHVSRCRKS